VGSSAVYLRSGGGGFAVFLTEQGHAGTVDVESLDVRRVTCSGFLFDPESSPEVHKRVTAAAQDLGNSARVHAMADDGELLSLAVTFQSETKALSCKVRTRRPSNLPLDAESGVVRAQLVPLKGYVVGVTGLHAMVYNATALGVNRSVRDTTAGSLRDVVRGFGAPAHIGVPPKGQFTPLLASNKKALLAMGFGSGVVAIFESHLPVVTPAKMDFNVWRNPLTVFGVVCLGVYTFFNNKRLGSGGVGMLGGRAGAGAAAAMAAQMEAHGRKSLGRGGGFNAGPGGLDYGMGSGLGGLSPGRPSGPSPLASITELFDGK